MNIEVILNATKETLLMTLISSLIAYLIGLPIGVLLYVTSKNGIKPNRVINLTLGVVVNIMRSIPCLLLIIILIPLTNFVFGKGSWSGSWYSMIIPLVFATFAFIARMVEQSLNELDEGVIEAARSLGATDWQIIYKVVIPEARVSLVSGVAVVLVSVIGYTAFAGYISGGGLIYQAFNYGYYGSNELGMWICVLLVVIVVQLLQEGGLLLAKKLDKRRKTI